MNDTLHEAGQAYLEHLKSQGKKERTVYTYGKDFEQIEAFFGADRKLKGILTPHVGKFFPLRRAAETRKRKGTRRAHRQEDHAGAAHVPGLGQRDRPDRQAALAQRHPHGPKREKGRRGSA